jgi:Leucine-rich repeat (LRR) protein
VELEVNHHKVKNIDKRAFEQNVDLMKIDFGDNEITDLDPELFEDLLQLREVSFKQNRLRSLPENLFEKNVDLLVINFAHNEIQEIPKELIDNLEKLREFYLNDNRIKIISEQIYKKTNLENLQLNNNEIEEIEVSGVVRSIDFKNQLEINLSNNKLESLPGYIFNGCYSIRIFNVSSNAIKNLNSDTFLNISIETIDFSANKIVEVSRDFPDNFKQIILTDNRIRKIHDSLYKNKKKLRDLSFRRNQIDEIFVSEENTEIVNVDEYEYKSLRIDLSANNLKELKPLTFGSIKSRLSLDFSKNTLKFLPENLFVGSKVGDLKFAYNLIENFDPNTFENAWLAVEIADFSNNRIELLDEKIFDNWKNLDSLDLSHNQIKVLPEKLFDNIKDSLRAVSFADNQISKIGNHTFVNCRNLEYIYLKNNTCFDIEFYGNRNQHEVCSDNCEDSCFLVNGRDLPPINYRRKPGILKSQKVCKVGKALIKNVCRFARIRQG